MRRHRSRLILTFAAILCIIQCVRSQTEPLEWAPCAVDCVNEVTAPVTDCQQGFRCFCNDQQLFEEALECWEKNCTVREALTSHNITAITCRFPDRDIGPSGTAVTFTSMAVALVFVGMQLMVFATTRAWGWDDILIATGTVLMIGNAICNPIARSYGFGKDQWRLPYAYTSEILEIFYAGGIIYVAGVAIVKMAFLCFYIRLFPTTTLRRVAIPMLILTAAQGITFMFLFAFQCSPISYTWTQWDGEAEGTCLGFEIGAAVHAIVNIILDFAIFALPIFQIRSLNLGKKKRWQVLLMFAVGFFVTLVSVIRIPSLVAVGESTNLSRDYIALGYWSDLELNIGVACFCMPAARVILRRYFPNCGLGSTAHEEAGYYTNTIGGGGQSGGGGGAARDEGTWNSRDRPTYRKMISGGKVVDVTTTGTRTVDDGDGDGGECTYEVTEGGLVAKMPRKMTTTMSGSRNRSESVPPATGTMMSGSTVVSQDGGIGGGGDGVRGDHSTGRVCTGQKGPVGKGHVMAQFTGSSSSRHSHGGGGGAQNHGVYGQHHGVYGATRSREARGEDDTDSDVELVPMGLTSAIEGGAGFGGGSGGDGRVERSMV